MDTQNMVYWASGSPLSWCVMMTLELKGLSGYPNKLLSFDKKEDKSEEVLNLNPRGEIPTFVHEGHVINEPPAICEYLERVYSTQGKKLLPDEPKNLALVLQRKNEVINVHNKGKEAYYAYFAKRGEIYEENLHKKMDVYAAELRLWEGYLTTGGTTCIAGNQLSIADVAFFPYLAFAVRCGLDLSKNFSSLSKYYQRMIKEASVEKTWPPHWKKGNAPAIIFDKI